MIKENIFVSNRFGEKLEALIRKPGKKGIFPAVIFVSGLGMDLHEAGNSFDEISEKLVENGFATVQFSFAGTGKSEGDYLQMTFGRQARQIEDVLTWIFKRKWADAKRIGLLAQSCGIPSSLAADLTKVKTILFVSGAFNPYENLKNTFSQRNGYNPEVISRLIRSSGKVDSFGPEFWKFLKTYNEEDFLQKISVPIFIIHSGSDDKIPLADAKTAFDMTGSKRKEFRIFQGGDHGMVNVPEKMRQDFLISICDWFIKNI